MKGKALHFTALFTWEARTHCWYCRPLTDNPLPVQAAGSSAQLFGCFQLCFPPCRRGAVSGASRRLRGARAAGEAPPSSELFPDARVRPPGLRGAQEDGGAAAPLSRVWAPRRTLKQVIWGFPPAYLAALSGRVVLSPWRL